MAVGISAKYNYKGEFSCIVSNVLSDKYPSSYTVFLYMSSEHSVFKGALTGHGSLRWIKESEIDKK